MKTFSALCCLLALSVQASTFAQSPEIDLLVGNNLKSQVIAGDWSETPDGLRVEAGKLSRCALATTVTDDYQLVIEFTRISGNDAVVVLIPVGTTDAAVELSGWQGESHGLVRIDGLPSKSPQNPSSVRPGPLENNKRYRLEISVEEGSGTATIQAKLDNKEIINWTGKTSRLQPHLAFTLRKNGIFGLAAQNSAVVFHSAKLIGGKNVTPPPSTAGIELKSGVETAIDLKGLSASNSSTWITFNSAQFQVNTVESEVIASAVTNAGSADRGAFMRGVDIKSGTIEVDVRGANQPQGSFLGLTFHAIDGQNYDAVYFRPFNFGSTDPVRRSHAIQYISHPDWPWDRLRKEKPNQYENKVTPEPQPTDWCHLKVEFEVNRVRAYVDNNDKPSLDVQRLSDAASGSVGLWFNGIAAFKNFKVTKSN